MKSDPFVKKYGNAYIDQLMGVADEVVPLLRAGTTDRTRGWCVITALESRHDLVKVVVGHGDLRPSMGGRDLLAELDVLRAQYEPTGAPSAQDVLSLITELSQDNRTLVDAWPRLAGEGALLALGDLLRAQPEQSSEEELVIEQLDELQNFIVELYQQIPPKRLMATLRKVAKILGSSGTAR